MGGATVPRPPPAHSPVHGRGGCNPGSVAPTVRPTATPQHFAMIAVKQISPKGPLPAKRGSSEETLSKLAFGIKNFAEFLCQFAAWS